VIPKNDFTTVFAVMWAANFKESISIFYFCYIVSF